MAKNWTEKQLDAIKSRNGSVLVSAAAGSGKTAVLVERVIERITDAENPTSVNRLLIVTFTRAAANEMRQRISDAIALRLKSKPGDSNLISQQMLLPSAKICTIDSFCNSLVRDNFQLLDISPDFKNADEGELSLLKTQAMSMTLEKLYAEGNRNFLNLVELLFKGRDDENLADMIYQFYNTSVSYPFPEKWLDETAMKYKEPGSVTESVYGKIIMDYMTDALTYCLDVIASMKDIMCGCEELERAFLAAVESDEAQIKVMLERVSEGDWDKAKSAIEHFEPIRRGRTPKELKDSFEALQLAQSRDMVKDVIKKKLSGLMCCSAQEFCSDMEYFAPMVHELCEAAKLFSAFFRQLKDEKEVADFNDIAHMALSLLVKESENGFERTELAKSVTENFDEILIDEYQDTNKAQDMLFTAISRNNLFRVGDVKQSIYRFRRAMPEIFIELKNSFEMYDRQKDNYPSKIVLGNNFRSRKSVTGAVNFIFSQMMSEKVGDIDYGDEEQLVFSAAYPELTDESAELHLLEKKNMSEDDENSDEFQARYIASLINGMINSGFTVNDSGKQRKAVYGDFCVLLRSVNGGRGAIYANQLRKNAIPCFAETAVDFFSAYEVSLVLSLLRVIDNPRQDIPLLTVMTSALFGFSVDELAALRMSNRESDIYGCLTLQKENGNKRVCEFLEKIRQWRNLSVSMGVEQLIREIYDDTSLTAIVAAMKNPDAKTANLMLLLDYAATYEKAGYIGLSGFIGFIDRLDRAKQDLAGSIGISADADVVKIMSIHKSKGLEFPVCIVANCAGKFNRRDEMSNMIISSKDGIGLVMRDVETLAQYPTVCHNAVKLSLKKDTISEEMRVLYVALTRAKEKLIMVGAVKDVQKTVSKYSVNIRRNSKSVSPFAVSNASSYAEWIITALMRHADASMLREAAGMNNDAVLKSDFSLKTVVVPWEEPQDDEQVESEEQQVDEKLLSLIDERVNYKYKYEPLTFVVSKRAASEVDKNAVDREYFASSRPAFLSENGLTAAQRGTATHTFMQYADYERAMQNVPEEIERLRQKGIITDAEAGAINVRAVERFFKSSLAKRILSSSLVMREKKFTVKVPVNELYPELPEHFDEQVMIQGIADCAFVENGKLVVVDYKTDKLETEEQFKEKYSGQVSIYQRALTLCTDYEVSETLLYSFALSREIKIFSSKC